MATALVRSFFFLRQNDPRIGSYFLFFVPSDAAAAEGVSSTNDAAKQTPPEPNKRRNERKQTGPSRRILGDVVFRFFFHFAAQRKIADSTAPIESSFLALSEKVIFSSLFFQIYKKNEARWSAAASGAGIDRVARRTQARRRKFPLSMKKKKQPKRGDDETTAASQSNRQSVNSNAKSSLPSKKTNKKTNKQTKETPVRTEPTSTGAKAEAKHGTGTRNGTIDGAQVESNQVVFATTRKSIKTQRVN